MSSNSDYFMLPNAINAHLPGIKSLAALKAYLIIRRAANPGTKASIGLRLLAERCGSTKTSILRGREELRGLGLIRWEEGGGRKHRTEYELLYPPTTPIKGNASVTVSEPETVPPEYRKESHEHDSLTPETVTFDDDKGSRGRTTNKNYGSRTTLNTQELPFPASAGGGDTSKGSKRPSKGNAAKTSDGVQPAVIKHFTERWQERYREKFYFLKRHARPFQEICDALGRDLAKCLAAVDHFISSNDKFIVGNKHRPEEFVSRLNSFTGDSPQNGDGTFQEKSDADSIVLNRK